MTQIRLLEQKTPELLPASRLMRGLWWTEKVGPKAAADTVLGTLAHFKFLAVGALSTGLLFVSAAAIAPRSVHLERTQTLYVDDGSATIPVTLSPAPPPQDRIRLRPAAPQGLRVGVQ